MIVQRLPHWASAIAVAAWMLGGVGAARAQLEIRIGGPRHPGASIRFGSAPRPPVVVVPQPLPVRPLPAPPLAMQPFPTAPPASIRHDYYHDRWHDRWRGPQARPGWLPPQVAYRHPYSDAYLRRFSPGYRPIVLGSTQYFIYPTLPPAYQTVAVNGVTYYLAGGVFYQPYLYEGQTVFMVVPPPL